MTDNVVTFAPNAGTQARLCRLLDQAKISIDCAQYELTAQPLIFSLAAAAQRGVKVRVVVDHRAATSHFSRLPELVNAGIPTRTDARYEIMHNKILIVDAQSLTFGSYNWSHQAETANAENCCTLYDQPALLAAYQRQFEALWAESQPAGLAAVAAPPPAAAATTRPAA